MKRDIIYILILIIIGIFYFTKKEQPEIIDNTKKYEKEIDSLNILIDDSRKLKDSIRLERRKIDSLIFTYEAKIKTLKPKINENHSAIINLSADSTFSLFTREITGSNRR